MPLRGALVCSSVCEVGVCVRPGWGVRPEGGGVHILLCVVLLALWDAEALVWMSLSALEAFGLLPAKLVGVEGLWTMAVGMAPACLASEVVGFLCVPGSRQSCHRLCGKGGPLRGGEWDSTGCNLGGAGEEDRSGSLGEIRRKGLKNWDKAFLQHLAFFIS